jgi:signal transduction histidine kinase
MAREQEAAVSGPLGSTASRIADAHGRLTAALLATTDSHEALANVCGQIRTLAGCDRVQIWRGDIRQQTMHTPIAVGYDAADTARLLAARLPMEGMPLAPDFLERKILEISHADDLGDVGGQMFREFGIRAAVLVLLERGERILGALQLSWVGTATPDFPAADLVAVIGSYASLAIDIHARTDEALQTASTLSDTAMALASIHDPDELLTTIARKIADATGCDLGIVYLVDDDSGLMRFAAGSGEPDELAAMARATGRPDLFEQFLAASEDDVVEFPDVRSDPRLRGFTITGKVASCVVIPLRRRGQISGALGLAYRTRTGRLVRRQLALAKGLALHAVIALETARLIRSLEETNRVKSDFVAAVSHDLRTPIHILVGYADMLLDGTDGELSADQRALVSSIRERSLHFRDLVDGILAVARLDAQRGSELRSPVDLAYLCRDLAREFADRQSPGVGLVWTATPTTVEIDGPKVRMILRNLISNALKFTVAGRVAFAVDVDGPTLHLRVTDTGPGIPPDERDTIFEMFHQGAAGRRSGGSGLGLGLYLVRRVARVLGGTAELREADRGRTTFEVHLPLVSTISA